ncbi:MAG: hypothetical protein ACLPN5_07840 [Roseiarcus sp.]
MATCAHDDALARLLDTAAVCKHPYIVGEIGLGSLRQRGIVLRSLSALPRVTAVIDREVLPFVERHALFGRGVGYVDVCLLAATSLTPNARPYPGMTPLSFYATLASPFAGNSNAAI